MSERNPEFGAASPRVAPTLRARRGPWLGLGLGGLSVTIVAWLCLWLGGSPLLIGFAVVAWLSAYVLGSTVWAFAGALSLFGSAGSVTDDATLLGLVGALTLLALVQLERTVATRRRTQPDDRVRRSGIVMLALVSFASFLITGIVELVTSDEAAGFQLPLGLTITAAVIAIVARLLERGTESTNAEAFRPGARH